MNNYQSNKLQYSKKVVVIPIILLIFVSFFAISTESATTQPVKEQRDDGLTIVFQNQEQEEQELQFVTLIIKTGYAHDPVGKFGLTNLTNELFYYLLRYNGIFDIEYQTYAEYSAFHFITTRSEYQNFYAQLDQVIRSDALLLYDLCNALVQYHLSRPKAPELAAVSQFYSLIYGTDHPYNSIFTPNYDQLNITEINNWFRHIYKPNNFIVASSLKLPDDFLRRPAGRNLKETVTVNEIPFSNGEIIPELKWVPVRDNIATICLGFETPRLEEKGLFATFLIEKYLDQRLWKVIREENGLSYDPEVYSLLISKSSAPTLQAILHTLAPDTGKVISMIIAEFKKIAAEGIPEAEIAQIIGQERKRRELITKDLKSMIEAGALYGLFDQEWLINQDLYLSRLQEESKLVSLIMTDGLAKLKIAVAGPEETGGYLDGVTKELEELTEN